MEFTSCAISHVKRGSISNMGDPCDVFDVNSFRIASDRLTADTGPGIR